MSDGQYQIPDEFGPHAGISKKETGPGKSREQIETERVERVFNNYHQLIGHIDRPKDNITWLVMEDLAKRADVGLKKYNTTLEENNHDNFWQHLYEELLDAAQYCKKNIEIKLAVQDLVKQYPNNEELGAKIREIYGKS